MTVVLCEKAFETWADLELGFDGSLRPRNRGDEQFTRNDKRDCLLGSLLFEVNNCLLATVGYGGSAKEKLDSSHPAFSDLTIALQTAERAQAFAREVSDEWYRRKIFVCPKCQGEIHESLMVQRNIKCPHCDSIVAPHAVHKSQPDGASRD